MRAAVVGAGLMGRWHAHAIAHVGNRVAWVIDDDLVKARGLARRHPGARVSPTLEEALDGVDVVHLCVPLEAHGALARTALDASRAVLVEKPLAACALATRALLDQAQARGVMLCPVHQLLFQRGVLQGIAALDAIGPILHLEYVTCSAGAEGRNDGERDRVMAEILPHPLSLAARILGGVERATWQVQHARPGELHATAQHAGATLSIMISMAGRPTMHHCRLIGERGTARMDLFHGFGVVEPRGSSTRAHKAMHPFMLGGAAFAAAAGNLLRRAIVREAAYPGLRELVRRFHRAAADSGPPPITPAETYAVAVARDRLLAEST